MNSIKDWIESKKKLCDKASEDYEFYDDNGHAIANHLPTALKALEVYRIALQKVLDDYLKDCDNVDDYAIQRTLNLTVEDL